MKILVSGSSGLVGSALISFLKQNSYDVYKLVRVRADLLPNEIAWDPERGVINPSLLEGFDAVVHLAGESIMGRWTANKKKKIHESRVKGTRLLCQALSQLKTPPAVCIVASAIGYYGNRGNHIVDEQSAKGEGFLADVCEAWEEATRAASERGIRIINLRLGMVLSNNGGALKQMLPAFKLGLGGQMGWGTQYLSWIAIDDLVRLIDFMIHQKTLAGPVNGVTPFPVSNQEMTQLLGKILHRPTFLTMPSFMVELVFGEMGKELLLSSTRVEPKKLEEAGFRYEYPRMEAALKELIGKRS